ncbi:hypothetical protein FC652_01005 [Vibrio sp. 05-20-BW147]|nr:hypothetical protein [Vibrio sp. 05-20-BW147]
MLLGSHSLAAYLQLQVVRVYPTYEYKKASTKLAFNYLFLLLITATQPTAGRSRILRWLDYH